ncbi:EcoKI restriction-modification system protein HsdS [Aquimixticola soesokkakensis]|uniref:EcoKI restriction-modification system protein HsdS n=1 Tax=Aquimixticola soesokkakensis TaxID=1519096 RepID=A0A1Y5TR02_9RHOB|nr:restriction endonuclease subunit S [Aquimixticola soesokkakensis]SLN70089.1 EcoKI restriction-modification system protein HsdS [Aquimixticola soesokkakensis]
MFRSAEKRPPEQKSYIETKIGRLPREWDIARLGDVTEPTAPIRYGVVQIGPDTPDGVPIVPIKHIQRIGDAVLHRASPKIEAKYKNSRVKGGDVLLSVKGTVGEVGVVPDGFEGNIAREIARIRPQASIDQHFLSLQLQAPQTQKRIDNLVVGSTRLEFSIHAVRDFVVAVPPLPEQRKIAEILRTWDEALEKLNALRAAKSRQLDGLAAKLIHDDQVERFHLREFLKESSTRNRDEQVQRVLSVTNSAGFVLAEEQFAHRVASASLSNYKIVRWGQYAYNPSRINVGSIARLDDWGEGALSPMYVVFQVKGGLDADFFGHWLRSAEARQRIALAAQGSVRETVSFGDLGSILVPVPTIERQQAIAKGLNAAQAEINLLDDEIKAVTRQKRGLMQKLLTGEWRVEVDTVEIPTNTKEAEHAG